MKHSSWPRLARAPASEQVRAQGAALSRYVREELYPFSAHYRRVFDQAGVAPEQIRTVDDLRRLPLTSKKDLLDAQIDRDRKRDFVLVPTPEAIREHWSFSRKLALGIGGRAAREILRHAYTPNFLTFTTGRSSEPVAFLYTPHDLDLLGEGGARMMDVFGLAGPDVRIVNAFPFAPHLAFWMTSFAGFRTGMMIVPTGGGKVVGSSGNLRLLEKLAATVLIATPGFAYHLTRIARDEHRDLSKIDTVILGAEKVTPGLKHKMAEALSACGAREPKILGTYGFTEARLAFAECPTSYDVSSGYHLYPDLCVIEVIDPVTLEPVGEGEDGEVVYTTISGHGSCVLRYRTGDLAVGGVTRAPCPHCGRTVPRLSSDLHRVSDRHALSLTKIRGTLVDLSSVGAVLSADPSIEEWQVVLGKKDNDPHELDEFEVRVALRPGVVPDVFERALKKSLLDSVEIAPNRVSFQSSRELADLLGMETEMKEKRFLDLRPKS
jgi:phenylacetate-coenzyme A ligase PaaK-like adenylate-forming protein